MANTSTGEAIPASMEAERAVLGSLLMAHHLRPWDEADAIVAQVAQAVEPSDFWDARHRNIYRAMLQLREDGRPIDTLCIIEILRQHELPASGAAQYALYIGQIWQMICTPIHAMYYASAVRDYGQRRRGVERAAKMMRRVWEGEARTTAIGEQWNLK